MVWVILICLASGDSIDDVLRTYPDLTREDIYATLSYAAELARLWEFWRWWWRGSTFRLIRRIAWAIR
jgi:hypothetical protein